MDSLVLTHGAGANRDAPLLIAVDRALSSSGIRVIRVDLPFRERRPHGPPFRGEAEADRAGIRAHIMKCREQEKGRVFLGGHSYGGRQATLLAAEEPQLADALLLLSYPLHPPRRSGELRTQHFPALHTPALFLHGTRDPFGTIEEIRAAVSLIAAPTGLIDFEGAGHDLRTKKSESLDTVAGRIASEFMLFIDR
jgi:predicted alpha/beta-hydrolase family hydrolase